MRSLEPNSMDKILLAERRAERQQIEEAIVSRERLAMGRGKRRGRPPFSPNNPDPLAF
jgi:hypothetical protein